MKSVHDRLPPALARDFDARLAKFKLANPGSDLSAFLASLHKDNELDTATLCEIVGTLEVELTQPAAKPDSSGSAANALGLLGRGAMGEVLLARDERLNRHVALKRILGTGKTDPVSLRRFQQEVQIMAQLDHPAIVPVYGVESGPDGVAGYAMKLVRGMTLQDYLRVAKTQTQQLGEPDEDHTLAARLDVFLQVCNAVHYAHTRGVIHRDLKPANIMIGAFGEVLVMDWGIARLIGRGPEMSSDEEAPADASSTMVGMAIGTPSYMSPEQANGGNSNLDGRSDQYTLGIILQEVVSLGRALSGKNPSQVLWRSAQGERDPFVHAVEGESIPRELVAIVARATQLEPAQRYADVDALADDVRRYLRDEEVLAAPDRLVQRATRFIAKNRTATLGVVLVLVVALFVGVGVTVAGAATVVEGLRYRAAVREEGLQRISTAVATRARTVDAKLQRYEYLLSGLAFAATHALRTEPPGGVHFVTPDTRASDPAVVVSPVYHDSITVDVPIIWRTPDTADASFAASAPRLAGLDHELVRVLLASHSDATELLPRADYTALVAQKGVPVVWAYVALDDGTMVSVPGAGGYPADYDPRAQTWYKNARARRTVAWDPAGTDDSDTAAIGLLVSAATGLWHGDQFLGVAGLDVSVHYVVDEMLAMPGLGAPVDTWLVDDRGQTIATSTALTETPPFPYATAFAAENGAVSGAMEVEDPSGTKLVAWSRLAAVDWTFVVVGSSEALLGASSAAVTAR